MRERGFFLSFFLCFGSHGPSAAAVQCSDCAATSRHASSASLPDAIELQQRGRWG